MCFLHLILVCFGAVGFDFYPHGLLGRCLDYYGRLSGAAAGYGFFAPGIFGQLRVKFDIVDVNGNVNIVSLDSGASGEASLRLGNIIEQFQSREEDTGVKDEALQRALSASLARIMFMRHIDAKEVLVRLETFQSLSMEEYRSGQRGKWSPVYEARYEHNAKNFKP